MNMIVSPALLEHVRREIPGQETTDAIEFRFSPQLKARFDKEQQALWLRWEPAPRPCFNPELLRDLRSYCDFVESTEASLRCEDGMYEVGYSILTSGTPGVFNLGGDLDLFVRLIEARDRGGLLYYGRACIDVLYRNYVAYALPITTISLVQGECLGGGFEAALSSDLIVAEKSARFGFPEILFNLFPGMGAYSFLERKVGQKAAEELIASGKIYTADDMLALGVIDKVTEDGQGEAEVAALIRRRQRNWNGLAALSAVRRRVHKLEFSELMEIVEIWVDAALRLTSRDMKLMQKLVSRQNDFGGALKLH